MRHLRLLASLVGVSTLLASSARAELIFHGDFETGDLKQWSYLLNDEGLSVVSDPVVDGTHAGKVTITKDNLWSNGLNRVEVQYKPDAARVSDGAESFYGYSFNVPTALSADNHQILYFETDSSYEQVMHVAVEGQNMYFATQKPNFTKHWEAQGVATPGVWHRLVLRVKWSADPTLGEVDLYFDGQKVVDAVKAQTYLGNPAFLQHGILRQPTSDVVETLYMDDARFGTTLDDVKGSVPISNGGSGGSNAAGSGAGGAGTSGSSSGGGAGSGSGGSPSMAGNNAGGSPSSAGTGTAPSGSAGTGATSTPAVDNGYRSGCSVAAAPSSSRGATPWLLAAFGLGFARRRRCARS